MVFASKQYSGRTTTVANTLIAALSLLAACGGDKKTPPQPKIAVVVATATLGNVPLNLATNGTVEPLQSVALQARVTGPVTAVHFREGDEVTEGQILFQIDSLRYQATLDQARAMLLRDRASALAARNDANRYASLVSLGYVTQSQTEQQKATADALTATVSAGEATVRAAEIDLGYTTVRAPISGKTGNLNVRVGNQVNGPSGVPLVVINAVSPVNVRFTVPEKSLPQVRAAERAKTGLDVRVKVAATSDLLEHGEVVFIDNAVDSLTGTVTLKARFPNTDRQLWPGAFVPVTLNLGELANVVLVPSVSVQQGPSGPYVFMPDSAGKARQVPVIVDRMVGDVAVITKGVLKGDRVVVDGQSRLYNGATMSITKKEVPALGDTARPVSASR